MDTQCVIRPVDRNTWLHLTSCFLDYNYRQSWDFGTACASRIGAVSEHIVFEYPNHKIVGLADVRIRKLPFIGTGIAYINGGPLIQIKALDSSENSTCYAIVNSLVEEYVLRRKLTLKIAPTATRALEETNLMDALMMAGFTGPTENKKTIFIDLFQDETCIRRNFHQKWRNHLSKSEKYGLTLRTDTDPSIFEDFIPLFDNLVNTKSFSIDLDAKFYENVQRRAADKDKFLVTLAEHNGEPVAGHIASILGNTCVTILRAVNNKGRDMKAAYLLHWSAIQMGKAAGCRWYDLGGIDPEKNPGVYDFKKRMGGREISIPGPYQMQPKGVINAWLTKLGESTFKALKPYLVRS